MDLHIFRSVMVTIFISHGSCYSDEGYYEFSRDATLAPKLERFDYIVIGGGTSGCALAATLSENATVLVLERGGSPFENPTATDIDNLAKTLLNNTPNSWSQLFISEDGVFNIRARVLGGDSVLNAGFYSRAEAEFVEEAELEIEKVEEAYEWVERKLVFEPRVVEWQSALKDGLLEAGVIPYNGFTYQHILGTKIGGTIFDSAGHRHSAANLLEYANRNTIVVYLHATVHKILFTTTEDNKPKAYGVIYQDVNGVFHKAELGNNAMNEVVLSAGAIGSPQLLMLSGVGPIAQLEAHGIKPVVLDQPMVGQGMGDNPMNAILVSSPQPVELSLSQVVGITKFYSFIEGCSNVKIPLNSTCRFFHGVLNLFNERSGNTFTVLPTQSIVDFFKSMDIQMNEITIDGLILQKVDGPISRGYLELRNTNPDDNPSVTFNYYQDPKDLESCVSGLRTIIKVINSKAFSEYKYPNATIDELLKLMLSLPINLRPKHITSTSNLTQFCIDTVMTIWHYHGGCQVGRVVEKNYKVLGIDALRVIDGSTFLKSPGTNPQATVMMLGRYMGQKILQERVAFQEKNEDNSIISPIKDLTNMSSK